MRGMTATCRIATVISSDEIELEANVTLLLHLLAFHLMGVGRRVQSNGSHIYVGEEFDRWCKRRHTALAFL